MVELRDPPARAAAKDHIHAAPCQSRAGDAFKQQLHDIHPRIGEKADPPASRPAIPAVKLLNPVRMGKWPTYQVGIERAD